MRPKLLEIEGLQSFGAVQRIDFTALGETGLFGIFGKTGSGKSTVLDAITFALYGQVRRANLGTQGIINTGLDVTKVRFEFELEKDGGRSTYRVERTYKRKKGSLYACEPRIARLVEITVDGEVPQCDKATDVTKSVTGLLGLSLEDFTRAVVLPQNSFQEFLMLRGKERRQMLERVFYLEEYGKRLQDKLARKTGALRTRLEGLNGELKGYVDATGEALEEARKAKADAETERKRLEEELRRVKARHDEAKTVWELVSELSRAEEEARAHRADEAAFEAKKIRLDRAEKAAALAAPIQKTKDLAQNLRRIENELETAQSGLAQAQDGLKDARGKYAALRDEAETERPKLTGKRTKLENALELRRQADTMQEEIGRQTAALEACGRTIREKKEALEKGEAELASLENGLLELKRDMEPLKADPQYRQRVRAGAELEREVRIAEGAIGEREEKKAELERAVSDLKGKLDAARDEAGKARQAVHALEETIRAHEAQRPEDRETIEKRFERLHALSAACELLSDKRDEAAALETRLGELRAQCREIAAWASDRAIKRDEAEAFYAGCRDELLGARAALDRNAAALLARRLEEGLPCPVCGSEHHPKPARTPEATGAEDFEQRLQAAEKDAADAEKALRDADGEAIAAAEALKSQRERIERAEKELERKQGEYAVLIQKLPERLRALAPEGMEEELQRMQKTGEAMRSAAEAWEKTLEGYKSDLDKRKDALSARRNTEAAAEAGLKVNEANLAALETELCGARRERDEKRKACAGFLRKYGIPNAAKESERLDEDERRLDEMQRRAGEAEAAIRKKREALETGREELQVEKVGRASLEADVKRLNGQKGEREHRIRELAGDADIEAQLDEVKARLDGYDADTQRLLGGIRDLEAKCTGLEKEKALLTQRKDIYSEEHKRESERLNTALVENGFTDGNEAEAALIGPERMEELRRGIEAFEKRAADLRARMDVANKKLDGRSITEEEWTLIENEYEDKAKEKEEAVARHEVARAALHETEADHAIWSKLCEDKAKLDHRQGLFDQMQKLFRANGFIDYIAEERLRYIALRATETLGVMTKYRYALELGDESGFVIRDNANGGVQRAVTTLSGGEVFLTSLALALALSEHIQLKGQSPLELFFLDEGFGSLDPELLDSVIDALERLVSTDRVIGLISHVPELRQRIGRRLIVDPPTPQGEGSRVRLER